MIKLRSCMYYIPGNWGKRRSGTEDYLAANFIRALKDSQSPLQSQDTGRVGFGIRTLDASNQIESFKWFAEWASPIISLENLSPPFVFVPVPSSSQTTDGKGLVYSPAALMASHLATTIGHGAHVRDVLRWEKVLQASHLGGERKVETFYKTLKIVDELNRLAVTNATYIIVDDVVTTGAHVQAVECLLRKQKNIQCQLVLCGGRVPPDGELPDLADVPRVPFENLKTWDPPDLAEDSDPIPF